MKSRKEKTAPTYAVNNAAIARALGLKHKKRDVLAMIGRWIKRDDFPPKSKHGWVIAELLAWHASFSKAESRKQKAEIEKADSNDQDRPSLLIDRVAVDARKEASVIEQWSANKLRDENKLTPFERAVLIKHGIIGEEKNGRNGDVQHIDDGAFQKIQNATTQTELAVMLGRYFHGRFKGDLSQQLIADWKAGKRLRKGVPLPPAKEGVYFIGQKWVDWIESHVLTDPRYRLTGDAQAELDIHDRAYEAKSEREIIERDNARFKFDLTQKKYVPVDVARNTRRGALKLQHNIVRRRLENTNTKERADWLMAHLSPEVLMRFAEFDMALAKAMVDDIEADYVKLAAGEPEKEQALVLAEESAS